MPAHHRDSQDPQGALSSWAGLRVLIVLTRDPTGSMSGRKAVLATIVRSLAALDCEIELVVVTRDQVPDSWLGQRLSAVKGPSLLRMATSVLVVLVRRRGSLNEALFSGSSVDRAIRTHAVGAGTQVMIADGIRTARAVQSTGLPWILHLDDLLSDRYDDLEPGSDVLGFFAERLPAWLRGPASRVARVLLRTESRLIARQEVHWARTAKVAAITSASESVELSARAGVPVVSLPMAVDRRATPCVPSKAPSTSMVFLGWLGYEPNVMALRWWLREVAPALDHDLGIVLTVVGEAPDRVRREFAGTGLIFTGYVDDLDAELSRHRAAIVPLQGGGGVKTKVLDALALGLPVVTTTFGTTGLEVKPGIEVLVADDGPGFAALVEQLARDPQLADAIGRSGYDVLSRGFSSAELVQAWSAALNQVTLSGASGGAFVQQDSGR